MKKPLFFQKQNLISISLLPISIIYLLFSKLFNLFFLNQKYKIKPKVICVGNIIVGGAGKTEIVKAISNLLLLKKKRIAILSKGYNRESNLDYFIKKGNPKKYTYKEIGDEPEFLTKDFDVFVLNKRKSIKDRPEIENYDYILMDDGYHDHSIKQDIKILVFDSDYFIGNGFLLPAGPMRDLIIQIMFADFIILTNFDKSKDFLVQRLEKYINKDKIFTSEIEIKNKEIMELKNEPHIAFSGLGNNEKFFNLLRRENFNIIKEFNFADHYNYEEKDIVRIIEDAKKIKGKIIATEKDIVKVPIKFRKEINYLEIESIIKEEKDLIDKILKW